MRFSKRKRRSHRKATTRGWNVVFRRTRAPEGGHESGPLPLPKTASMQQRTVPLPKLPARTAYAPSPDVLASTARRVADFVQQRATFGNQLRIDKDAPLFRDDAVTWDQLDAQRLERLRRMQHLQAGWSDGRGVNLGSDQSPRTLTFSTVDYRHFAGDQGGNGGSR